MPIHNVHVLSNQEIRAALEESSNFATHNRIERIRRRRSVYSSSYWIENLFVEFQGGQKVRMIIKDVSPGAVLAFRPNVRPALIYQPEREIEVYRHILRPAL